VIFVREHRFRQLVEAAGALAVIASFVALVRFYIIEGYLPAPFVFDTYDTFMDWFHTAYWAHNEGAYSVWRTIYLPLSFVITGLIADPRCYATSAFDARECDLVGVVALVAAYVAAVLVTAVAFYRNDRSSALFRTLAVAVGGPLLFALERGNLILMAYVAFVLIYGRLIRSKAAVAAAAGFLVNMKVYLLFPILAFAIKREWRRLELCGLSALAIYLASLAIVGAGSPFELASNLEGWFGSFVMSVWDQVVYSTTYAPYLLFDQLYYPVRDFVDQRTVDLLKSVIRYEILVSRSLAIFCLLAAWFYPQAVSLNRLVFFILMQSFLSQNPGGYAIALIVFLVFMERSRTLGTMVALVCCYLVSLPMDIPIATILEVERVSWVSGRITTVDYVLTVGAVLRPALFVIMLWSLAIDTLIDIHRAVKTGPPTVGLSLRKWRQAPPANIGPAIA
jgi:hypothetical protein